MPLDNSHFELSILTHQGFVGDEEEIQRQTNARKVVRKAVIRARLGLPALIVWTPKNFSLRRDDSDEFCELIREGVEWLIVDVTHSDDETDYVVLVEHLRGCRFGVFVIRNLALRC